MGSSGSKPRKPQHSQHLPKAGTKPDNQRMERARRQTMGETMGTTGVPRWVTWTAVIVVAVLILGGFGFLAAFWIW